jgi:hypothetical protein
MTDLQRFIAAQTDAGVAVMLINDLQGKFHSKGKLPLDAGDFEKIDQIERRLAAANSTWTSLAQFTRGAARPKTGE